MHHFLGKPWVFHIYVNLPKGISTTGVPTAGCYIKISKWMVHDGTSRFMIHGCFTPQLRGSALGGGNVANKKWCELRDSTSGNWSKLGSRLQALEIKRDMINNYEATDIWYEATDMGLYHNISQPWFRGTERATLWGITGSMFARRWTSVSDNLAGERMM